MKKKKIKKEKKEFKENEKDILHQYAKQNDNKFLRGRM